MSSIPPVPLLLKTTSEEAEKAVNSVVAEERDFEERMLAVFDKYLSVECFCFSYFQQQEKEIEVEVAHVKKLMHGKKANEQRIENLEQRLEELAKKRSQQKEKQTMVKTEAVQGVVSVGDLIYSMYSKAKLQRTEMRNVILLTIWRLRDNAKLMELAEFLRCDRFPDILPENVGKLKLDKRRHQQKFRKDKIALKPMRDSIETLDLDPKHGNGSNSAAVSEGPQVLKPVSKKPLPPAQPQVIKVKLHSIPKPTARKAWGGWGKPTVTAVVSNGAKGSKVKSLLEIQQEEEEELMKRTINSESTPSIVHESTSFTTSDVQVSSDRLEEEKPETVDIVESIETSEKPKGSVVIENKVKVEKRVEEIEKKVETGSVMNGSPKRIPAESPDATSKVSGSPEQTNVLMAESQTAASSIEEGDSKLYYFTNSSV